MAASSDRRSGQRGPMRSSEDVGRSGYAGAADWPSEPDEPAAASDPEPLAAQNETPPMVRVAASRNVVTTLSAECGKVGGFPGR
jgi:hypothetical protein